MKKLFAYICFIVPICTKGQLIKVDSIVLYAIDFGIRPYISISEDEVLQFGTRTMNVRSKKSAGDFEKLKDHLSRIRKEIPEKVHGTGDHRLVGHIYYSNGLADTVCFRCSDLMILNGQIYREQEQVLLILAKYTPKSIRKTILRCFR